MKKIALTLENINKSFISPEGVSSPVIKNISVSIADGEFFVFVGPSGSGKSTLLRIMSGLDSAYTGTCTYGEHIKKSDISFVFQNFALLPWMTVEENIAIGLVARNIPKDKQKEIVNRELKRFGLKKFAQLKPRALSGGMKQRVGFARALATDPKILFLDEAFSELDSFIARELHIELLKIWSESNITVVMVTHIIDEAVELADRVAIVSSRPATIKKLLPIKLKRPRERREPAFFDYADKIYEILRP